MYSTSGTCPDVFVRDRLTGTTQRVSVDSAGAQANDASTEPSMSGDGSAVMFFSAASNLVADDTHSCWFTTVSFFGATARTSSRTPARSPTRGCPALSFTSAGSRAAGPWLRSLPVPAAGDHPRVVGRSRRRSRNHERSVRVRNGENDGDRTCCSPRERPKGGAVIDARPCCWRGGLLAVPELLVAACGSSATSGSKGTAQQPARPPPQGHGTPAEG